MSLFSKKRLKTSYRDQMIRELQHLHAIKQVKFSEEVTELMGAVEREQARTKKIATYRFWQSCRLKPGRLSVACTGGMRGFQR